MTSPTSTVSKPVSPLSESEQFYDRLVAERGVNDASGFSRAGQLARFKKIVDCLPNPFASSLLDVGCGNGDLYFHLKQLPHTQYVDYTGIDRNAALVAAAQTHFRSQRFIWADLLNDEFFDRCQASSYYEFVVASGVLCWASDREWHFKLIWRMWQIARRGIVFNVPSALGPPPERSGHARFQLATLGSMLEAFPCSNFRMEQGYHRGNDLTVALYKA